MRRWTNERGQTCDAIHAAGCNDKPVNGQSSNQACCICVATRVQLLSHTQTRVSSLLVQPRTANRYSCADCGFVSHNLTLCGGGRWRGSGTHEAQIADRL